MEPSRRLAADNRPSLIFLVIVPTRDNHAQPLSKAWQGRFYRFLVEKGHRNGKARAKKYPECHAVVAAGYARCPECG